MSSEEKPITMSATDFVDELKQCGETFKENMLRLKAGERTFPEWYEMFGRWNEVGTKMEKEYHGPRSLSIPKLKREEHAKDCFWHNDWHTCDCGLFNTDIEFE